MHRLIKKAWSVLSACVTGTARGEGVEMTLVTGSSIEIHRISNAGRNQGRLRGGCTSRLGQKIYNHVGFDSMLIDQTLKCATF